jgi:ribonuclease J
LGEIGRNCAALEVDGKIALIDVGLMFPEEDMLGVDLVFPDWSWLVERNRDVSFVVLTHGHEDHMGALAYFLRDIQVPVYGTELSVRMAEGRIEEVGVEADLRTIRQKEWITLGPFKFMLIPVSHSVPDASAIAFDTPEGIVLHSGDFKLDPTPIDGRPTDLPALASLGRRGVRLLLADSTNAEKDGFEPSESSVGQPIADVIRDAPGRVIAACFSSHVHRVQQIADAGMAAGRKVAFFGRSMHRYTSLASDLGILEVPDDSVVDIKELADYPASQQLLITTGSQGEPFAALSLMSQGRHKFVELNDTDTVLISAKPIPGNETAVSKVVSNLMRRGASVVHGRNSHVHVSGHAVPRHLSPSMVSTATWRLMPPSPGAWESDMSMSSKTEIGWSSMAIGLWWNDAPSPPGMSIWTGRRSAMCKVVCSVIAHISPTRGWWWSRLGSTTATVISSSGLTSTVTA